MGKIQDVISQTLTLGKYSRNIPTHHDMPH